MTQIYWNPTSRLLETGALHKIPEILRSLDAPRVLIIMGGRSFRSSRHYADLRKDFSAGRVIESEPVLNEPKLSFLRDFVSRYREENVATVIGIGGGSVLDTAKAAALLLSQPQGEWERAMNALETYRDFKEKPLPFIAVPTTAGTGSEVTPYASFENEDRKKITLSHPYLFPRFALVDPALMISMPARITAATGFDALSQSIESFWSIQHTPYSDTHALRAIPLLMESLEAAVKKPDDMEARTNMALASTEAGLAIAQTRTTAVHSVSYPITTLFQVPHGHACALTLASFIRFNQEAIPPGRREVLWRAMGCGDAEESARKVEALMTAVGLEKRLSGLGIDRQGIESIVQNGFRPDRVKNNPRPLNPIELRHMLLTLL